MTMIVLAVLALICVTAMANSAWAVFSIGMTIPIALLMGIYLKYIRPGHVNEISAIGFILLLVAILVVVGFQNLHLLIFSCFRQRLWYGG